MATKTSRRVSNADAAAVADNTIAPEAATGTVIVTVPVSAPRITKAARLRAMLDAPGGASLADLMAATGWQAHTVRAALSGLRKSGTNLAREKCDGDTVYRIVRARAEDARSAPQSAVMQPTIPGDAANPTGVLA